MGRKHDKARTTRAPYRSGGQRNPTPRYPIVNRAETKETYGIGRKLSSTSLKLILGSLDKFVPNVTNPLDPVLWYVRPNTISVSFGRGMEKGKGIRRANQTLHSVPNLQPSAHESRTLSFRAIHVGEGKRGSVPVDLTVFDRETDEYPEGLLVVGERKALCNFVEVDDSYSQMGLRRYRERGRMPYHFIRLGYIEAGTTCDSLVLRRSPGQEFPRRVTLDPISPI